MPKRKLIKAGDAVKEEKTAADESVPMFDALTAAEQAADDEPEYRKVRIPSHRYTPLRKSWPLIVTPLVEQLKLQVRFNPRSLRRDQVARDDGGRRRAQKGADFVSAFAMGFEVADALALLRLEDLFVDSFEVAGARSATSSSAAPQGRNRMRTVAKRASTRALNS
ncbi:RNA binding protein [Aureococcus anophagefferens]|uniref:RNA binding protein n=1 Tax=Aureococcus anophagefferens TaxID=44056 RepID=A0ABR1FH93_AURAN